MATIVKNTVTRGPRKLMGSGQSVTNATVAEQKPVESLAELRRKINALENQLADKTEEVSELSKVHNEALEKIASQQVLLDEKEAIANRSAIERGYVEGMRQAEEAQAPLKEQWVQALRHLEASASSVFNAAEPAIVDLAFSCFIKLVGDIHANKFRNYHDYLRDCVMKHVRDEAGVALRIHVAPADYAFLVDHPGDRYEPSSHIQFIRDESIGSGGWVIKSEFGELDARLQTRMQGLIDALINTSTERSASVNKTVRQPIKIRNDVSG